MAKISVIHCIPLIALNAQGCDTSGGDGSAVAGGKKVKMMGEKG
jgi:hypothetical protein